MSDNELQKLSDLINPNYTIKRENKKRANALF